MPPEQSQGNNQEMGADDAAASLALATHISHQSTIPMGEGSVEGSVSPETAPEQAKTEEPAKDPGQDIAGLESRLMEELKNLKEEVKAQGDGHKEIADLKKQIEEVLNTNE